MKFAAIPLLALSLIASASEPTYAPADGYPRFALGADVSWTPYIEQNRLHTYYDAPGPDRAATTVPELLFDHGIDAVRLRVWVDPDSPMALSGFAFQAYGAASEAMSTFGTCSVDEMTALARRLAMQGHRVMVSFQFSDTWADPGHQFIPASWAACSDINSLTDKAVGHVADVLTRLHDANVNVAWVQLGNEVNTGMLKWQLPARSGDAVASVPFGCEIAADASGNPAQTARNFVDLFAATAAAARAVYPDVLTVLHLANADRWSDIDWTLGTLARAGFSAGICDYVGLSLYPGIDDGRGDYTADWPTYADLAIATIERIRSDYGFRTILCEIGLNNEYSLSADTSGVPAADLQQCYIDRCNTDVAAFTRYLIGRLAAPSSTCDGLFYWEPETDYMKGYTKGACVSADPGPAWPRTDLVPNAWWATVRAASTFPAGGLVPFRLAPVAAPLLPSDPAEEAVAYYNLLGVPVASPTLPGLYLTPASPRPLLIR